MRAVLKIEMDRANFAADLAKILHGVAVDIERGFPLRHGTVQALFDPENPAVVVGKLNIAGPSEIRK